MFIRALDARYPLRMSEGGPSGGGNTFSADYVARLQADLEKAREDLRTATAAHIDALTTAKQAHADELAALRQQHQAAVAEAKTTAEAALAEARTAGERALVDHQAANRQRLVSAALRSEAATIGMVDMDALKLLDPAEIEKLTVDDAGVVAGAKPLVEALKKGKPFLFGQASTSNPANPPSQTPPVAKSARDMTDAEFAEATKRRAWRQAAA